MTRNAVSMSGHQDLSRREKAQNEDAIIELRALITEGEASGIGTKTMEEIKAEARKELGL